jgi:hypothetical protein
MKQDFNGHNMGASAVAQAPNMSYAEFCLFVKQTAK